MNLQHDGQGFLAGDRVGPQQSGAPAAALIGAIHRDVAIIRRLLTTGVGRAGRGLRSSRGSVDDVVESAVRGAIASPSVVRQVARSAVRQAVDAGARAAVAPRARDSRGRFVGSQPMSAGPAPATPRQNAVPSSESLRDARGRFSGGGASDLADGGGVIGRLASAVDGLGDVVSGADNIDPTISALKEVRDAVSPVGRGFMALHARLAERKKERWYARILKAITGRSGEVSAGGGSGADVQRGSFFGTMLGELGGSLLGRLGGVAGGALGFIGTILSRVFAPVAAVWASWEVGQWIGGKINEWLDKSGMSAKIIDAFIGMTDWFKRRVVDPVKDHVVKPVAQAIERARDDVSQRNGARISTGMMSRWDRAKKNLKEAADQAGVDPGLVAKIAAFESGFDPNAKAPTSSAHGYGQFIDSTWVATVNKHGAKYGVQGAGSLSKVQALALRGDPKLQAAMLAELTKENVALGRTLGGSNDDANAYALHNLGTGDGSRFLRALKADPSAPISSVLSAKVMANNPALYGGGKLSIQEAYNRMGQHMAAGNIFAAELGPAAPRGVPVAGVKPAPAMATLQAIKPQSVPASVPERVQVVQPDKTPERVGWGREARTVVVQKEEVGQDVRDRKLAHIVTGGIGG